MIDEQATKKNVKQFFKKDFNFLVLSSGFSLTGGSHPVLTTDLKDYEQIANKYPLKLTIERAILLKKVITAMSTDERTKAILFGLYVEELKNCDLFKRLGVKSSQFFEIKGKALLKFADNIRNVIDLHGYK